MEKEKRGLSPVVATTLLIAMVVALGLVIFLWFRGFQGEAITKFGGTNVEIICEEVVFSADYSLGSLFLTNNGDVPIYDFTIEISGQGSTDEILASTISGWPEVGLDKGATFSGGLSVTGDEIEVIPVLRGQSDDGVAKTHTCDNRYGKELEVI